MPSSLSAMVERARGRFRQDVADQLRMAAEKAGLSATVTLDHERAVLELDETRSDAVLLRVVAAFRDERSGEAAASGQVTLCVETQEERSTLLTLAWADDAGLDEGSALQRRLAELEARTDERLPLARRGLNAPADVRTGRYARGDVIRQLAGDLKRAVREARPAPVQLHALVAIEQPRPALTRPPDRGEDSGRRSPQAPPAATVRRNAPM